MLILRFFSVRFVVIFQLSSELFNSLVDPIFELLVGSDEVVIPKYLNKFARVNVYGFGMLCHVL